MVVCPLILEGVIVKSVTVYASPGAAEPGAAIVLVPAAVNESATFVPSPKIPPAILTSTLRAFAGNVPKETLINPAPPSTEVPVGAVGTLSAPVRIEYPGDQSLSVPSGNTYWN